MFFKNNQAHDEGDIGD